jgi:hypothetical protein
MLTDDVPPLGTIADGGRYSRWIETAIVTTQAGVPDSVNAVAGQLGYRHIMSSGSFAKSDERR